MGVSHWRSILGRRAAQFAWTLPLALLLPGCGLLIDAIEMVRPIATDEVQAICLRQRVQIGMAAEPFRPFVFPAIWTDEGARVTGLDVELITQLTGALTRHCGTNITPVLHLVRFRDLFTLLNEGQLDLFVSAVAANIPSPTRAGLAYSIPYFYNGGLGVITTRADIADRIRATLRSQTNQAAPDGLVAHEQALAGFTVAVQEWTAAHWYAEANLKASRLILCDSLPAAFEAVADSTMPSIDIILGGEPVLEYMVKHVRKDWRLLTREDGKPLFLTRGHYAVVMAEDSYRLRWFVNNVLLRLDESGRLAAFRARWLDESYAFPRRAATEGLPFDVGKMVAHYDQGICRPAPR